MRAFRYRKTIPRRTWHLACVALAMLAGSAMAAVPFWGARESSPVQTAPSALKPGEWVWNASAAPAGPIAVVVSLTEQRAYVYRNGVLIGTTTVSTGRQGHETPTGVFTILQKDKDHHSSIYNQAAMPYMQRLTWGGVALHAGGLPGYPESHGCVHLPSAFAAELFAVSPMGMTVVIAEQGRSPEDLVHPAALAPLAPGSGEPVATPLLEQGQAWRWQPELSLQGPVSIILSGADRRIVVLRNGVEIGRAGITLRDPATPLGTHVYVLKQPDATQAAGGTWSAIGVPGNTAEEGRVLDKHAIDRVSVPPAFVQQVAAQLPAGTTLLVTDHPMLPGEHAAPRAVLDSEPADSSH